MGPEVGIKFRIDVRTTNPNNGGLAFSKQVFAIRTRKKKKQHTIGFQLTMAYLRQRGLTGKDFAPMDVTLTRVSMGTMDDDGLRASQKWVRDGIAEALGFNDRDIQNLRFRYRQRKEGRGMQYTEVVIEQRPPRPAVG